METRARSMAALAIRTKALQEQLQTVPSYDISVHALKYGLELPDRTCSSILNDISQSVNWSENTGESSGEGSSGRAARREALASLMADRLYGEHISNTEFEKRISFKRWNEELDRIIWRLFVGGTVNWFTGGQQSQLQQLTIRIKDSSLPQDPSTAHSPTPVVPKRTAEAMLGEENEDRPRLRPRRALRPHRYRDLSTPSVGPPPALRSVRQRSSNRTSRQTTRKTTGSQKHGTNSCPSSSSFDLVEDKYTKIIERLCIHIDIRTVHREISCYLWLGFVPNINQFLLWVKRTSKLAFDFVDVVKVQILNSNDPEQWLDVDPGSGGINKTKSTVEVDVPDFRELLVENLVRRPGKVHDGKINITVNIE